MPVAAARPPEVAVERRERKAAALRELQVGRVVERQAMAVGEMQRRGPGMGGGLGVDGDRKLRRSADCKALATSSRQRSGAIAPVSVARSSTAWAVGTRSSRKYQLRVSEASSTRLTAGLRR